MTDLIIKKETMTSLEIAEVTGKRHDSILRDIRNILSQGVDAHNFVETYYTDKSNRQQKCYTLTKKGCLILASGYDVILREKIINRWEELETKERNQYQVPKSFAEALMLAAKQQEQITSARSVYKKQATPQRSSPQQRLQHRPLEHPQRCDWGAGCHREPCSRAGTPGRR